MGEIIRISCGSCNYEKQLRVGGGLLSTRSDIVDQNLQGEDLAQWKSLCESGNNAFFAWKYEAAYCDVCKELQSCFKVDIRTGDGEKQCLGGRCETCHKQLAPVKLKEGAICPFCGESALSKAVIGRWD